MPSLFAPIFVIPALALATAAAVSGARADVLAGPVEAQVLRVIDGDSIHVRARIWLAQDVETIVRLDGIDTPELRGRCDAEKKMARDARAFLESRVAAVGGMVQLSGITQDKYGGRVLARVTGADGTDLAAALRDAGLARTYEGGSRQAWCPE